MVEQDPAAGVEAIGLTVVDGHVVPEHLRHAVGASRVERRPFVLRGLADLAEHLAGRRLVELDGVALRAADHADGVQHPEHSYAGDIRRQLRLAEREGHEADGTEVVDLVGLHLLDGRDQRGEILQVAFDHLQLGRLFLDHLDLRVGLPAH